MPPATKLCSKCLNTLPLTSFALRAASKDGHQNTCKTCQKEGQETRREKAPAASLTCQNVPWREWLLHRVNRAAREEWVTTVHRAYCSASPEDRASLLAYIAPDLGVRDFIDLAAAYSHGFGGRGWGHVHAWGSLPEINPPPAVTG